LFLIIWWKKSNCLFNHFPPSLSLCLCYLPPRLARRGKLFVFFLASFWSIQKRESESVLCAWGRREGRDQTEDEIGGRSSPPPPPPGSAVVGIARSFRRSFFLRLLGAYASCPTFSSSFLVWFSICFCRRRSCSDSSEFRLLPPRPAGD
jgi:hypothetical protein